jgi:hypothetical protein
LRDRNNAALVAFLCQARFAYPGKRVIARVERPRSRAGLFLMPTLASMLQRMTAMERAFDLARSGRFATLAEIMKSLSHEGYSADQIEGPLLKRQLTDLIRAARRCRS